LLICAIAWLASCSVVEVDPVIDVAPVDPNLVVYKNNKVMLGSYPTLVIKREQIPGSFSLGQVFKGDANGAVTVYPVFVGAFGSSRGYILRALQALSDYKYFQILSGTGAATAMNLGGSLHYNDTGAISDAQLNQYMASQSPSDSTIFVILEGSGVEFQESDCKFTCGYHGVTSNNTPYVVVNNPSRCPLSCSTQIGGTDSVGQHWVSASIVSNMVLLLASAILNPLANELQQGIPNNCAFKYTNTKALNTSSVRPYGEKFNGSFNPTDFRNQQPFTNATANATGPPSANTLQFPGTPAENGGTPAGSGGTPAGSGGTPAGSDGSSDATANIAVPSVLVFGQTSEQPLPAAPGSSRRLVRRQSFGFDNSSTQPQPPPWVTDRNATFNGTPVFNASADPTGEPPRPMVYDMRDAFKLLWKYNFPQSLSGLDPPYNVSCYLLHSLPLGAGGACV